MQNTLTPHPNFLSHTTPKTQNENNLKLECGIVHLLVDFLSHCVNFSKGFGGKNQLQRVVIFQPALLQCNTVSETQSAIN